MLLYSAFMVEIDILFLLCYFFFNAILILLKYVDVLHHRVTLIPAG